LDVGVEEGLGEGGGEGQDEQVDGEVEAWPLAKGFAAKAKAGSEVGEVAAGLGHSSRQS
jgi:hypothetical protein